MPHVPVRPSRPRRLVGALTLASLAFAGIAATGDVDLTRQEALQAAASPVGEVTSLVSVHAPTPAQAQLLGESFDLTEHGRDGWLDVVAYPGDTARLEALGLDYRVRIPDLVARDIADRRAEAAAVRDRGDGSGRLTYRVLADYEADMDALIEAYPDMVRGFELPHETWEGRTVRGLEIAMDVERAATDGRPTSVLMGVHHAREWPSGEVTMDFAIELMRLHDEGNTRARQILEGMRILVIPVVNPDGFVRSRETISDFLAPAPGLTALAGEFAYHRKNLRPNGGTTTSSNGIIQQGTDPNRNYPYKWGGPGTSTSPAAQTYHGPAPASEPEIQNVLELLRDNQVLTLISNHTFGNLILRPFGDTADDNPDESLIRDHADAMATINGYDSIKGIELYPTTGTTEDWVYGVTGALSYTFELGDPGTLSGNVHPAECAGFHPQYNLCYPTIFAENFPAFLLNVEKAMAPETGAVLEGTAPAGATVRLDKTVTIPLSAPDPDAEGFVLERTESTSQSIVVGDDGTFRWAINPSHTPGRTIELCDANQAGQCTGAVSEPTTAAVRAALAAGVISETDLERYTVTITAADGRVVHTEPLLVLRGETYRIDA